MKKFNLALMVALLGCGFAMGCDDGGSSSKAAVGETCSAADECESGFCNADGKCDQKPGADECADKEDGTECADGAKVCKEHVCSDKGSEEKDECADKEDGTACADGAKVCKNHVCSDKDSNEKDECADKEDGTECANGAKVCKEHVCSDKDECAEKDDGTACANGAKVCKNQVCSDKDECADKEDGTECADGAKVCKNQVCSDKDSDEADECADKEDGTACANGAKVCKNKACVFECTNHEDCEVGYCLNNKCGLPAANDKCLTEKPACINNKLYVCNVEMSAGGESEGSAEIEVTECGNDVCVADKSACLSKCEEAGKKTTKCDASDQDEDGGMRYQLNFTCTKIGDDLLNVPGKSDDCGVMLCDEETNMCTAPRENGVICSNHGQCKSGYCADVDGGKKCAAQVDVDADCAEDAACKGSDVICKGATDTAKGKCTKKVDLDKACTENKECLSNNCDNNKCAKPKNELKDNGVECNKWLECKTGYCDGAKCADLPVAPERECSSSADCKDATKNTCSANMVCVSGTGKSGYGDACSATEPCGDKLACHTTQSKCRTKEEIEVKGKDCTKGDASVCSNNVLVSCEEDPYAEDELFASYIKEVSICAYSGRSCQTSGGVTACMEPCTSEGATKSACQSGGEGEHDFEIDYTCTKIGTSLYFVPKAIECMGMTGCGPDINKINRCL